MKRDGYSCSSYYRGKLLSQNHLLHSHRALFRLWGSLYFFVVLFVSKYFLDCIFFAFKSSSKVQSSIRWEIARSKNYCWIHIHRSYPIFWNAQYKINYVYFSYSGVKGVRPPVARLRKTKSLQDSTSRVYFCQYAKGKCLICTLSPTDNPI